jgi:RNA polymerase sigma factor (sigma-70 family)
MIRESPMPANGKARDPAKRGQEARESAQSYETFYKRYQPRLTRYLVSQASDIGVVEDVVQETMIAAYDKLEEVQTYERPDSWLFKVATRKLRRMEARARERCLLPEDLAGAEDDLRLAAADDKWIDDHIDLVAAIRSLPRRQCEVISLHYLVGYTLTETAQILGIAESTVKTHAYRGLSFLQQHHHDPARTAGSESRVPV